MQKIELADRVCIEPLPHGSPGHVVTVAGLACPDGRDNIVHKALTLWGRETNSNRMFHVHIDKRIPLGAGLGGGSSDAAAVLRYLAEADADTVSAERLVQLAAAVGADVPFCLEGVTSLCGGIGEVMEPLPVLPAFPVLLLSGGAPVSTKAAFNRLDEAPPRQVSMGHAAVVAALRAQTPQSGVSPANDFLALCRHDAEYAAIQQIAADTAPLYSGLSGSGPTFFLIYRDAASLGRAVKQARRLFPAERLIVTSLAVSV